MAAQVELNVVIKDQSAKTVIEQIQKVADDISKKPIEIDVDTKPLKDGATDVKEFAKQEEKAVKQSELLTGALRTISYVLVNEVRSAFRSALTEMKNVDTELITIQKVTNESTQGMKKYSDTAYDVAKRLGASASEYLNAVAEFAKAGYGDNSQALGELAITTAKVGDTTQQVANQFLLSVDAAYKYKGNVEALTAVLDGSNEIGNRYATSVEKMAEGLGKVSPIAAQAHVSIGELTAAIGTITAVTQRSGQEAATALRALFLNIMGDTKTEIEDGATWTAGEIQGLRDVLNMYASDVVKAAEATGSVINPMEAIGALAQSMKDGVLTEAKLMEMVTDIGGKLRSSQLLALIQNWGMYESMFETYTNAAGSAAEEYAIYLNSWEAKTKQLSATWTEFVQNAISTKEIKGLLDTLIGIVDNLDEMLPLIVGIGVAIGVLNIGRFTASLQRIYTLLLGTNPVLLAVGAALATVSSIFISVNQQVKELQEAASGQNEVAKMANDSAMSFLDLYGAFNSAKKGSEEYVTASASMQSALEAEGRAVNDLAADYRSLTIDKLNAAVADAQTAVGKSTAALEADFSKHGILNDNAYISHAWANSEVDKLFASSSAAKRSGAGMTYNYTASDKSAQGILNFYNLVGDAIAMLDKQAIDLGSKGSEIYKSELYKDLSDTYDGLSESVTAYTTALDNLERAEANQAGFNAFEQLSSMLREDYVTDAQALSGFLTLLNQSVDLSDEQRKSLANLAYTIFPEYAEELGIVTEETDALSKSTGGAVGGINAITSALEKFKKATKSGLEKDDPFKEYAKVFEEVMSAGEAGAFGSNAFQYGIQALLDPETIQRFGNDWKGLYEYIKETQTDLYSDAESMGTGLLDRIVESGEEVQKGLYQLKDDAGNVVAEVNTLTGEWKIDDTVEGLSEVAGQLDMSAESVVALAQALGMIDPSTNTEELEKSLQNILSTSEEVEEEDPEVTVDANTEPATTALGALDAYANQVTADRTMTISVKYSVSSGGLGKLPVSRAKGDKNFAGGPVLVNDEGGYAPELIVANGEAFIVNGGDPAVTNLPYGAKIYTASETRDIFGGAENVKSLPAMYAGGTVDPSMFGGKKTPSKPKSSPSGGGTSISSGSTGMSTDDILDKLDKYMEKILETAEDALNDELEAINAQIYALRYQTEAAEKATALEEARLELLQAEQNLLDANTERTVRYYNASTGQWEWMADQQKVLSAQEELADAQKNLLEAEYDALETAWKELKDAIESALNGEDGEIDIDAVLAALGASAASGSLSDVSSLISSIFSYIENPKAYASFDRGGIATGLGFMPKGTAASEAVLDENITRAILNPRMNEAFTGFTDSLVSLFNLAGGSIPGKSVMSSITNMNGGNTYIEGVKIGSDMMNRPLSEVLSVLSIYNN